MIHLAPGARNQRAVLAGVVAVASILMIGRVIPAWISWNQAVSKTSAAVYEQLAESHAAVARATLFESVHDARDKKLMTLASALLDGETVGIASAEFSDVLVEAASDADVALGAIQLQSANESTGSIRILRAHCDVNGDIAGILRFTATLEGALPVIAIRRLTMSTIDPGAGTDHAEVIRAEYLVDAIARVPSDSTSVVRPADVGARSIRVTKNRSLDISRERTVNVFDATILDDAADSVVSSDPFRLDRKPSAVAFGAVPVPTVSVPVRVRPQLVLGGIVGGPPWRALLAGVPGREGSIVLATGDTAGGLRVRSVGPREIVVASIDTVWKLTVKQ